MIIYLHIAKTGGTTMLNYLKKHCKTFHVKSWWSADWVVPDDTECIFSHCPYGEVDKHIPGDHQYITFLRDPIDRIVSYYYDALRESGMKSDFKYHSRFYNHFMNLIQCKFYSTLDNGMVRVIAGRNDIGMIPTEREATGDDLIAAKENLKTFAAVGTLDTFDDDLSEFAEKFGWKDVEYKRYRTGRRPKTEDVDPEFIEIIRQNNILDQELFEFARENGVNNGN